LAPGLWYLVRGDLGAPVWVARVIFAVALALTLAGWAAARIGSRPVVQGQADLGRDAALAASPT
jgi:hypothetical protein